MTVLIIAAAPEQDSSYIMSLYKQLESPYVLCVDGGRYKAEQLGIVPDMVVGDFDSSPNDYRGNLLRLPKEKDLSDTEAALEYAATLGAEKIFITGALGGREDHSLCNLFVLLNPTLLDNAVYIYNENNIIMAVKSGSFTAPMGYKYFSVIPVDFQLSGVSITGVKYPLCNATLYRHKSLGLSNEIVDDKAVFTCEQGSGFLIFSKD